jgi:hypothetical protein
MCTVLLPPGVNPVAVNERPYILESNTHPGFGDLLNGKKLVRDSNTHLSFNHPMPTWQLTE